MSEIDERLAALKLRFLARSAEDLAAIETETDREALRRVVHRLAGAAGTFGFSELSRLAGEADDALVLGQADIAAELERLTVELKRVLAA